ncbi:MAG: NADH:flavin oxidoreductase [Candidatus Hodarchaeales archaeon]|jgi:2,4-dienoyl-CoA reductase-like NADH-dependent reductase (Old Yellow Enzyme family)
MSILYEPKKIGRMEVKNRFVRSATLENMATETGKVTEDLVKLHRKLAKGEVGLIIPGYVYVHPLGQAYKYQTGIYNDDQIPGLKRIVDVIHKEDGKIAFQIVHAGMQTFSRLVGAVPAGPSGGILNPTSFENSREMTEEEIQDSIEDFISSAKRVVEAGTDAVQLHAAHGYLINQFLSPFYNRREDEWGGSAENRFRYLREIVTRIKKILPTNVPLLIKLNTNDFTPDEGVTLPLAAKYSQWLEELGLDAIEVSCGSGIFSIFNMCRGDIPVKEIVQAVPEYMQDLAKNLYGEMIGQFDIEEGYNLDAAKLIKSKTKDIPVILVGGLRNRSFMEEILENRYADFISMSRPFIREPSLVKSFKEGRKSTVDCISCNKCLGAIPNDYPIRCYANTWPKEKIQTVYFP